MTHNRGTARPPARPSASPGDLVDLSALLAIQAEIGRSGLNLDALAGLVARRAAELTWASGAAVALADGEALVERAAVGVAARLTPPSGLFSAPGLRAGEALRCDDAEADPRVDRDLCRRLGVRSMVVVPLPWGGATVGVLRVLAPAPGRFGERDVRALQLLAALAGAAVGRAADLAERRALIAGRAAALEALGEAEDRFRAFMDNGPAVAFLKDAEGRYLYVNAPMERHFHLGPAAIRGKTDFEWLPEGVARQLRANDRAVLESGRLIETTESVPSPDGMAHDWLVFKFPVADRAGRALLGGVAIDISERKALERRLAEQLRHATAMNVELERRRREAEQANCLLAELATTDGLTGLKNVRHFREALDSAFTFAARQGQSLSLILLDVDHFKAYNDAFGHPAGDEVLVRLAESLRCGLRSHDVAARYGGEEFVILLPGTPARAGFAVAERLRGAIAGLPWPRQPVTASFGIATTTPATAGPAALIEQADRALYQSKQRGRDRVTHHKDMTPAE